MATIYVRAKAGRVARTHPRGPFIPEDEFVPVTHTRYIDRLLNHHKDIVLKKDEPKSAPKPPAAKPAAKSTEADKKENS